jgi:oligosaccharide reducing-end xylanase
MLMLMLMLMIVSPSCGESNGDEAPPAENSGDLCSDNIDNDGDDAVDCDDAECSAFCAVDTENTGSSDETDSPVNCAFESGEYRNYFLDLDYTEKQSTAKLNAAWASLFEGDEGSESVYFEAGENDSGPLAYVMDISNNDVRSEGMSYGMMIAVQLDKPDAFNALWNFSKTYMWHGDETHPFYEYFAWNVDPDGTVKDDTPAPDGEEYFAMALYFAEGRWGNGDGIYNYREAADRLVSAMKNREPINGSYVDRGNTATDSGVALFNPDQKMVRFSPKIGYFGTSQGDHTDPSYHLPAFYELWSIIGPEEDRTFWKDAAEASRDFFEAAANPDTGLTPDYAEFGGKPVTVSWDPNTKYFRADARRTVMNWSVDWAWFCLDDRAQTRSDALQSFFKTLGPQSQYDALFELDGTPLADNYYTPSLVAMNAVSALSATDESTSKKFAQALWNLEIPVGTYRYYDGMLYMLALLHVSGNFRIYLAN